MLTPKQKAFADYFIECGNASEAARKAGYSKKTAGAIGEENLKKPEISAYIDERMAQQDADRVATADEVVRFYSSVMRGEVKDSFGLDASLSDRLKAADSLMKRYAVGADREKNTLGKLDELIMEMKNAAMDA
jgi:phage terminase small subunit